MNPPVIVLHGLALNKVWTSGLAGRLEKEGFDVHNISYATRKEGFENLVDTFLKPLIDSIPGEKIHFAVHSMGGLMVRFYAQKYGTARIGRVVMLGTPNHGSELADTLRDFKLFHWFAGDAGQDLGTAQDCLTTKLGPVTFECGIIAGDNKWFHFPTSFIGGIKGPNDGIVSVESTKVEGMKDHIVVSQDHTLMIWSPEVWRLTVAFLKNGRFTA